MKTRTDKKITNLITDNKYNIEYNDVKDIKNTINSIDTNVYKNFYNYDSEVYTSMIYFYDTTMMPYAELRLTAIGKTEKESVDNVINVLEKYAYVNSNDDIEIITISSMKESLTNGTLNSFLKKMNNDSVYLKEIANISKVDIREDYRVSV